MDENLFGEPFDTPQIKHSTEYDKKKRKWERGFQKWSDKISQDGSTYYGKCGNGAICDCCKDNSFGSPCVRALNEFLRCKRLRIDYDKTPFYRAFDGDLKEGNA